MCVFVLLMSKMFCYFMFIVHFYHETDVYFPLLFFVHCQLKRHFMTAKYICTMFDFFLKKYLYYNKVMFKVLTFDVSLMQPPTYKYLLIVLLQ